MTDLTAVKKKLQTNKMAKPILKVATNFATRLEEEAETRSVHFVDGTKPPPSDTLQAKKFAEKRKLEQMKPVQFKLSYWTLRYDDSTKNQKYLKRQRKQV